MEINNKAKLFPRDRTCNNVIYVRFEWTASPPLCYKVSGLPLQKKNPRLFLICYTTNTRFAHVKIYYDS